MFVSVSLEIQHTLQSLAPTISSTLQHAALVPLPEQDVILLYLKTVPDEATIRNVESLKVKIHNNVMIQQECPALMIAQSANQVKFVCDHRLLLGNSTVLWVWTEHRQQLQRGQGTFHSSLSTSLTYLVRHLSAMSVGILVIYIHTWVPSIPETLGQQIQHTVKHTAALTLEYNLSSLIRTPTINVSATPNPQNLPLHLTQLRIIVSTTSHVTLAAQPHLQPHRVQRPAQLLEFQHVTHLRSHLVLQL